MNLRRSCSIDLLGLAVVAGLSAPAAALAQATEGSAPALAVPPTLPDLRLPDVRDLKIAVPRPVQAAQAVLGMGRQRLALVIGLGTVGNRQVVDSAARNTQAVAAALRKGGFVVMVREDLAASGLRGSLKEFRDRLQPGGVGFIYVTGLGAQVDGRNLLLTRDAALDATLAPAQLAARLRETAVPLDELSDALVGTADSPRLLVVDAAWQHPALTRLPQQGLAEPRLPHGTMALFGHALGSVQEVPAVAPLPLPAPADAVEIAATPFVRTLVGALLKPRINGPEALRSTRRAMVDATIGQSNPWLGGDTDSKEELAEASLLDGLIPRTPEEIAREALRQGARLATRPAARAVGEQSVADVLAQNSPAAPVTPAAPPADTARPLPDAPGPGSLGSTLGSAASALGTAASVAATAASVAAAVKTAQAVATVSAATTAVGVASSAASALGSTAVALGARMGGSSQGGAAAAAAASTSAAVAAPAAVLAPAAAVAAVPVAAAPAAAVAAPAAVMATRCTTPAAAITTPAAVATPAAAPLAAPAVAGAQAAASTAADATATATPPTGTDAARRAAQAAASAAPELAQPSSPSQNTQRAPQVTDGRTQRSTNGGERPVYAPRTNSFGYAEGDTFTYQVTDTWKGEVVGNYTTAIEEVLSDGKLLANGQQTQMDPQGRLTQLAGADGSLSQFEPFQDLWWSNPKRGESRAVKFIEKFTRADRVKGQTEWKGSTSVGRLRKIETPAGQFEVLPIETSGWWTETLANGTRNSGQFERTVYYAPKLGHPVAIDVQDADRLGKLLKRERVELMHAQTARSTP